MKASLTFLVLIYSLSGLAAGQNTGLLVDTRAFRCSSAENPTQRPVSGYLHIFRMEKNYIGVFQKIKGSSCSRLKIRQPKIDIDISLDSQESVFVLPNVIANVLPVTVSDTYGRDSLEFLSAPTGPVTTIVSDNSLNLLRFACSKINSYGEVTESLSAGCARYIQWHNDYLQSAR